MMHMMLAYSLQTNAKSTITKKSKKAQNNSR